VETIVEERQRRALQLEREAKERDPQRGAAFRTVGLAALTAVASGAAIVASFFKEEPTREQMVIFPIVSLSLVGIGSFFMRKRLLDTRFNRDVFSCLLASMGFLLIGRLLGLVIAIPPSHHFISDSLLTSAIMAVCAYSMLRWTAIISALFLMSAIACAFFPASSMWIFSLATSLTMAIATFVSWWMNRQAISKKA
jgi:hypothetical protein